MLEVHIMFSIRLDLGTWGNSYVIKIYNLMKQRCLNFNQSHQLWPKASCPMHAPWEGGRLWYPLRVEMCFIFQNEFGYQCPFPLHTGRLRRIQVGGVGEHPVGEDWMTGRVAVALCGSTVVGCIGCIKFCVYNREMFSKYIYIYICNHY